MQRRELLVGGAALAGLSGGLARAAGAPYTLRDAAREAWLYTLPLNEIANVRARNLSFGGKPNTFIPQKSLAGPEARTVTTPNNDTIYASAFIDLTKGPAILTLPDLGARYASFAIMDMWSDNIAVLGTRTTGPEGGRFILSGPDDMSPPHLGPIPVRSPTPWVWALARVVVNGDADIEAARAVQAGYKIDAIPSGARPALGAKRDGPWYDYFKAASALLMENPPPSTDIGLLRRIRPLNLGPTFNPEKFTPSEQADIAAGMADAIAMVKGKGLGADEKNGWLFQAADTGQFFQDYVGRAKVALGGLAALPAEEAMYLAAVAPSGGTLFEGDGVWKLRFPKGQEPPVSAFWSLTMYEATPEGQFFLTQNPIKRYAIGDRTAGMTRGADGSLTIYISRKDPGGARSANWLPAPAKGPFAMFLRLYLPKPEAIARVWAPPRIEKA